MEQADIREQKRKLRREILAVRDGMSPESRLRESREVCSAVTAMQEYILAGKLLAFANYGSELVTEGIIEAALAEGKEVYLPKVQKEQMRFYRIFSMNDLTEGYKGIREPYPREERLLRMTEKERAFLLLPGVAFDREGGRIGYGKGFYDRFLAEYGSWVFVCGIALSCQIVESGRIPLEETDYRVTGLVFPSESVSRLKGMS